MTSEKILDSIPPCGFRGEYVVQSDYDDSAMAMAQVVQGGCNIFGQPELLINIQGVEIMALVDTGAPRNFIDKEIAERLKLPLMNQTTEVNHVIEGKRTLPMCLATFSMNGGEMSAPMAIDNLQANKAIMGMPFFRAFDEFQFQPKEKRWRAIKWAKKEGTT